MNYLMVGAASYRCGSTLIQRLLNTSEECLIHGEDQISLSYLERMFHGYEQSRERSDEQKELFAKNKDCWQANLLPDRSKIIQAMSNYLQTMYYDDNYKYCGMKQLYPSPTQISKFNYLLSGKTIFVHRNIESAYSSYMEMYGFINQETFMKYYNTWSREVIKKFEFENTGDNQDHVYFIKYEDINEKTINELFDWIGIENRSMILPVLTNKIREVDGYDKNEVRRKHNERVAV